MGTSTAGLSTDEDALAGRNTTPSERKGDAAGIALFDHPGQLYGALPFPPGPAESGSSEDQSYSPDDNLEVLTPTLKKSLSVVRVGSNRSDNNLLSVFAGLKNKSAHPLNLQVETIYRDSDQRSLSDGSKGWVDLTLKPHQETQYRSVALTEDASDFLVRVRRAPSTE